MAFAIFFLAEYANMILIAALTAVLFVGGWESFFAGGAFAFLDGLGLGGLREPGLHWLAIKIAFFLFCFLSTYWLRMTSHFQVPVR